MPEPTPAPSVPWGRVVHRTRGNAADGSAPTPTPPSTIDTDVIFEPSIASVWTDDDGTVTHVPDRVTGRYDEYGVLRLVLASGELSTDEGVILTATNADGLEPSGWVWHVRWPSRVGLPRGRFTLNAGGTVDLSSVVLGSSVSGAPVVFADLLAAAADLRGAAADLDGVMPVVAADRARAETAASGAASSATVATAAASAAASARDEAEAARDEAVAASAETVTGGHVDASGDLILTMRGGGDPIAAGRVVGDPGNPGPANSLSIGTVTTLAAGSSATASVTGASPSQTLNLGIPRGATGATGAVSAWEYYAAGRPDVVGTLDPAALAWRNAAPSGSTFYSTDGPQGAWVWRKRGASWVCVEGDTGWRDVTASLVDGTRWNNVKGVLNYARVRREGVTVFLQVYIARTAAGLSRAMAVEGIIFTLPSGFESAGFDTKGDTAIVTGGVMYLASSASTSKAVVGSTPNTTTGTWVVGDLVRISGAFATHDVWPATLPGIPA